MNFLQERWALFVIGGLMLLGLALALWQTRRRAAPPNPDEPEMARDVRRLATVMALGFVVIGGALTYWQVVRAGELVERDDNARRNIERQRTVRGDILDRNGQPIVKTSVRADGRPRREYLVPGLTPVTGYTSPRFGRTGIEASQDSALLGEGALSLRDWWEHGVLGRPAVGHDVVLTIDLELQRAAEEAFERYKGPATAGALLVLDPRSGEILALLARPFLDPSRILVNPDADPEAEAARVQAEWLRIINDPTAPLLNRATQGLYPPGSTFKTVTVATALEQGKVRPDRPYQYQLKPPDARHDRRWHENGFTQCRNHPNAESFDLGGAYGWSCNVAFSELGPLIGTVDYIEAAKQYGIEGEIPLEIPVERSRLSTSPNFFVNGGNAAIAQTAFGQGELAMTPLQMALVACAVANRGQIMRPHLVRAVRRKDGEPLQETRPESWRGAIKPETANRVRQMMLDAVDKYGVGAAKIAGIKLGAKTGTAETGDDGRPAHGWVIALAPADSPRFAVAVVMEFAGSGSNTAVPAARQFLDYALKRPG